MVAPNTLYAQIIGTCMPVGVAALLRQVRVHLSAGKTAVVWNGTILWLTNGLSYQS